MCSTSLIAVNVMCDSVLCMSCVLECCECVDQMMDEDERVDATLLVDEAKLVRGGAKPERLERIANVALELLTHWHDLFALKRASSVAGRRNECGGGGPVCDRVLHHA